MANAINKAYTSMLPTASDLEGALFNVSEVNAESDTGYESKKASISEVGAEIVSEIEWQTELTETTDKTITGAINEIKRLVDILPQFSIEVVNTLPVSDISETTIYLVPASDPEQGNYYEEYIYVNNAWELVGTTAVDLSGYYTSAQVDTLLAAKANISSLATVATSGAYSDLTGKPTIDTALDTTSTNAVENRAVAGEINSIKSDITVEGSASGDIATFVDGSDNPLKELKISIEAVQSGSGDPSPTNVRPITGWTGANVTRTGINIWDEEWEVGGLNASTGGNWNTNTRIRSKNYFPVKPNTVYFNFFPSYGVGIDYCFYDINKTFISSGSAGSRTITSPQNAYFMRFATYGQYGTTYNHDISINYPSTDTSYHAYNGNTYNISWEDEAGTVYGGTLDVKTGVLTVTHANIASYDGETINEPWISSMDVYSAGATPTTGAQVVYPLTTPVTYQLTPTEVRSLLGVNNVWADCGVITELKYTRDLNLCINDIISRIEALENTSSSRSLSVSPMLTKSLTSDSDTAEGKTEEETEEETKEEAQNER